MSDAGQAHWLAVKRIFQYLSYTKSLVLTFSPGNSYSDLVAYSDSNWAGDSIDRRSTCGFNIFLNGCLISWSSKKQSIVALSSSEAEYIGLTHCAKEIIWLRQMLVDFGLRPDKPTILYGDNQISLAQAKNPIAHARSKHIDIRHHFIREKVQEK